jgi:hypothetical protein
VIDPIDGTKNFMRGVPTWATLIGLVERQDDGTEKVIVGSVSAPALNRRWYASTGNGAFTILNNATPRKISVSKVGNISDASIAYSDFQGWGDRLAKFQKLMADCTRSRGYGDFWSHIADVAFWVLQPQGLKSIAARGEQNTGISNVQRWIDVDYEFEDLKVYWTSTVPNVPGSATRSNIGAYFEGDKGTLICDYNTHEVRIGGELVPDLAHVPITIERSPGHQQNFVNAVKSRTQPESNLEYARKLTLPMHLGLISYKSGRKLEWNDKREKFVNDREANQLLSREKRKEWDLT